MPKQKTNRAAAKRFLKKGSGFKHRRGNRSHILTKKGPKRKRQLAKNADVNKSDVKSVKFMLNIKSKD